MYQLFNGYHLGTNRSVFALFPRPHTVSSKGQQIEYNLIRGERQLEGVQDLFLIAQVPRSIPGICVRGYLDTAHKGYASDGMFAPVLVTRRTVGGCGEWTGDRFASVAPPSDPPRMQVVGEYQVTVHDLQTYEPPREPVPGGAQAADYGAPPRMPMPGNDQVTSGASAYWRQLKSGREARISLADDLNKVMSDVQQALLANAAAGTFTPIDFVQSETFRTLVGAELRQSSTPLVALAAQGYVTAAEMRELVSYGLTTVGALFSSSAKAHTATSVAQRLVEALGNPRTREARAAEQAAPAGSV